MSVNVPNLTAAQIQAYQIDPTVKKALTDINNGGVLAYIAPFTNGTDTATQANLNTLMVALQSCGLMAKS